VTASLCGRIGSIGNLACALSFDFAFEFVAASFSWVPLLTFLTLPLPLSRHLSAAKDLSSLVPPLS
jgi:hypothetical protein